MKKKIIFTVTNDLSYDQRMQRICTSLAKKGHDVVLLGRQLTDSRPLEERNFQQLRLRLHFTKGKLFYLEYNLRLLWFLFTSKWDAVCGVDLDTIAPCFLSSTIKGKPCVYDAHEYFTEVPEVQDRPVTRFIWEMLARVVIPRIKYAYTVGPVLAKVLSSRYKTSFAVIRNVPFCAHAPNAQPPGPEEPFVLIYQGVLNCGRGLDVAIRTVAGLGGVQLWIFGEGDLSDELRALAASLKVGDKVVFHGKVLPDDLRRETPKAHVGLNLLENKGLNYYYSLANKAFDYIQAGVPAICMDFPEYRELNQRYAVFHLLEDLTVERLTEAVLKLKENRKYLEELKTNCREAAKELCWEQEEEKLYRFWDSVLQ